MTGPDELPYVADLRSLATEIARIADLEPVEQVRALRPLVSRTPTAALSRLAEARREAAREAKRRLGGGHGTQYALAEALGISEAAVSYLVTGARRYKPRDVRKPF